MALPSGFSTTLSNPIGIRLVLLGLVVMPIAVPVLPFNIYHTQNIFPNEENLFAPVMPMTIYSAVALMIIDSQPF
jgi:ABC-type transport system involved in cytochrome c biogenesis permease component